METIKILFLDIDGVCNSKDTFTKDPHAHFPIDNYMAFLVGKIQLDTDCKIVLSSSWRHHKESVEFLEKKFGKFYGITDFSSHGIRGLEIHEWLTKNVEGFSSDGYRNEKFRIAILDDDSDMLLWQKDSFFKTSFDTGLTDEVAKNIINHLNS